MQQLRLHDGLLGRCAISRPIRAAPDTLVAGAELRCSASAEASSPARPAYAGEDIDAERHPGASPSLARDTRIEDLWMSRVKSEEGGRKAGPAIDRASCGGAASRSSPALAGSEAILAIETYPGSIL